MRGTRKIFNKRKTFIGREVFDGKKLFDNQRIFALKLLLFVAIACASATTTTRYVAAQTSAKNVKPAASITTDATSESFNAPSLSGASLRFRVLLPADYYYARNQKRYPVLYLLHGADAQAEDWLTRTNVALMARRYNLIVVLPSVGNTWYANSAGDASARYEDAIIKDLIPHVDNRFRTLANWHARAVAGLSMGGFGAMKFALRYPQMFVFAASFSGAFDAPRTDIVGNLNNPRSQILSRIFGDSTSETRKQNDVFLLIKNLKENTRTPYFYVSTGNQDPLSSVLPSNPRFADALRERKLAYEYHELPGSHDWRFWGAEIETALQRMGDFIPQMKSASKK